MNVLTTQIVFDGNYSPTIDGIRRLIPQYKLEGISVGDRIVLTYLTGIDVIIGVEKV